MDKSGPGRGRVYRHDELNGLGSSRTLLIIKLPDSRSLRIVSRSLFLAMLLLALPSLASIINASLYDPHPISTDAFKILPIILRDLVDDGLLERGHKGFLLGAAIEADLELLRNNGIDLLTGADLRKNKEKETERQVVDYVYAPSFQGIHLVDGILKEGGLLISPLGLDPSYDLRLLKNFKIVYLRRFENTVAAMRKMEESSNSVENSSANEVLCGITPEKKKAALKGLEDVYLEPPNRAAMTKRSSFVSRKIKFLPDLLKESLDEYPRRVFITDESRALDWFYNNYPVRDQEFEVYDTEVNAIDTDGSVSDLMKKINLRPEDYVVMKAEAQMVEQMMKDETMCVVDELFMECRNEWEDDVGEESGMMKKKKRAYWQCLALYGRVRDEGIAVHQWL